MESPNPITAAFVRFLSQELRSLSAPVNASCAPLSGRVGAVGPDTIRLTLLSVAAFLVRMTGEVTLPTCVFWTQVDNFLASQCGTVGATVTQNRDFFENIVRASSTVRLENLGLTDLRLLPALQDFDSRSQTAFAERARHLLWEFSCALVAADGESTLDEEGALEDFSQVLAGRTSWALLGLQPGNLALLRELKRTVDEAQDAVELALKGTQTTDNQPRSGHAVLAQSLQIVAVHLTWSIGDLTDDQVRLFRDFSRFFDILAVRIPRDRVATWREWLEIITRDPIPAFRIPSFLSMDFLAAQDLAGGTNYAERCKAMFLRFATAFATADGTSSEAREAAVAKLKEIVYAQAYVPVPVVASPAPAEQLRTGTVDIKSSDELLVQLNSMVGLNRVKIEVKQLVSFLKVQQLRAQKGLPCAEMSRHLVFSGNPGTGKTTVARLLAAIYKSLGILSKGHLIETDRAGLVAGFLGQTALKVRDLVNSALGGVLFIDEAYALVERQDDSFGREAVDTLLKMMEDHRDDLIVVAAGYTDKMSKFLSANPGMKSRFNKYITFDDYSPSELVMIFAGFCTKSGFDIAPDAAEKLKFTVDALYALRDETFGNGRLARNLFETTISNQAARIVELPDIDERVLTTIDSSDIPGPAEVERS